MSREIGALTEQLSRPTAEDIVSGLNWLMDGGMTYPPSISSDKAIGEYVSVLKDVPSCGLRKSLTKLKRGLYENISLDFVPTPASLAAMSRAEAKVTIDDLARLKGKQSTLSDIATANGPRLPSSAKHQFRDLRIVHRQRSEELSKQGYRLVAESITSDAFLSLGKSRAIPAGSIHLWAIDEVWAPSAVAHLVDIHRIEAKKRTDTDENEPLTAEKAEYWSKINDLKDAKEVTSEQMAFRRKIESDLQEVEPDNAGKTAA